MENSGVKQGHGPGEAVKGRQRWQAKPGPRGLALIGRASQPGKRTGRNQEGVTLVMSKDGKGQEAYGRGGNAK